MQDEQVIAARRRAEIDADLLDMGRDPDYQREAAEMMAGFVEADAESARLITAEYGPYPYDDDELAELAQLIKGTQ